MQESHPVDNPIVPGAALTKEGGGEEIDPTVYKKLIGSLMYVTIKMPYLTYVACLLARFMSKPRLEHLDAAKRVLKYLKGTTTYGIFYGRESNEKLKVFTDSDYARDVEDRKCTSGYICLYSGAAINWSSWKQEIVTLSSTEAEYVAAANCACHCKWLKGLLEDLGEKQEGAIEVMCDNTSTIKLSENPVMHRRTKHIDVRYHFLRDLVNQEELKLAFCDTKNQLADIMTKPIKLEDFCRLRASLGLKEVN